MIPTTPTIDRAVLEAGVILTSGPDHTFTFVDTNGVITDFGLSGPTAYPVTGGAILLGDEGMSGLDLNGDGAVAEGTLVAHVWQPTAGVVNLGLTVARFSNEFDGMRPVPPVELPGTGRLVILVSESEHASADLSGDGDLDDAVAHLVHIEPHQQVSLRGEGLGVATFGDAYEETALNLDRYLGPRRRLSTLLAS